MAIASGENKEAMVLKYDTYRTMPLERRLWFEENIRKLMLSVAKAWPSGGSSPKIVWRECSSLDMSAISY
jgi:hypothetical protein